MSLSSYLASKYLTADPDPSSSSSSTKKRKRKTKDTSANTGLIIADDDADWAPVRKDDDEDTITAVTSGSTAEFRKAKQSAWKSVREPTAGGGDDAQADAIVAQAARENEEAGRGDEDPSIVKMGDGTHAGLQSGAAVADQVARATRRERARWEKEEREGGEGKKAGAV
ncbi:hypothetical protein VE04_09245, partial [Pseudogymnoascus sp. 24MN13]